MHKMLEYGRESRDAFELESQGRTAEGPKNRAEWAKAIAGEVFKRHDARSQEVNVSNGEAIPGGAERVLHDTLTVPDLASVEASFERTQLLVQQGPLTLRKLRQGGHQRISVQYVNVTDGSQAVISNVQNSTQPK
jgi:hypothetical protein